MSPSPNRVGRILADLRRRSEELKRRGDELQRRSERVEHHTEAVRQDWRRKRADPNIPGAVPEHRGGRESDDAEDRDAGS